ncbi:MAG: hypothetical protein LUO94_07890 [Methylococcaceae bacterium]|nr:hypothetical protein [Methylococcaceae bacterium]
MPSTQAIPATNRLLAALPRKDREQLLANCEQIELIFSQELNSTLLNSRYRISN